MQVLRRQLVQELLVQQELMAHFSTILVKVEVAELVVLVNMEELLVMPLHPEDEVHIILAIPQFMVPQMRQIMIQVVEQQILGQEEQVEPKLPH